MWAFQEIDDSYNLIPEYVQTIELRSFNCLKTLATSCAYVSNIGMSPSLYKFNDQLFIQTWHGDRPFKKVLYDVWDERGKDRPIPVMDNKITDVCIAASDIGEKTYRSAFRYTGEVLRVGMPRNDQLVEYKQEYAKKIKKMLHINGNYKILIYAPTFRDYNIASQEVNVDLECVLKHLEQKGDKWVCLLRAHSATQCLNFDYDGEKYIDVTSYPDMADLLLISDMLITDYSSSAGDFILRKKPVILAMYDREVYENNCRGFSIDVDSSGFLIANNQKELENIIDTYTEHDYIDNCNSIISFFNIIESGHSAELICDRINTFAKKNKIGTSRQINIIRDIKS